MKPHPVATDHPKVSASVSYFKINTFFEKIFQNLIRNNVENFCSLYAIQGLIQMEQNIKQMEGIRTKYRPKELPPSAYGSEAAASQTNSRSGSRPASRQ